MKLRHVQTVDRVLRLEIGFAGELGAAGLTEAIIEALEQGGVLEEAGIVYIRAEAPGERLMAVDIWAPEPEEAEEVEEPPTKPTAEPDEEPTPQPNL